MEPVRERCESGARGERRRSRFRLLVFDWDGTLLDSVGTIVACTERTLADLELPAVPAQRIRSAIGTGLRETVELIHPGCDDRTFDAICRVYRDHWLGTYNARPMLFDGAADTLERLRAEGYELAVATAKGRLGLDLDLERTGVAGLFRATRTVGEAAAKPDPEMLLDILAELGRTRGESLMVGDSLHDVRMALNAGVAAVGVATGTEPPAALIGAGASDCLEDVTRLPAWLERMLC